MKSSICQRPNSQLDLCTDLRSVYYTVRIINGQTSSFLLKHSTCCFSSQMKSGVFRISSITLLSMWSSLKTDTGNYSQFFIADTETSLFRTHSPVFHVVQLCWHHHTCTWTEGITLYSLNSKLYCLSFLDLVCGTFPKQMHKLQQPRLSWKQCPMTFWCSFSFRLLYMCLGWSTVTQMSLLTLQICRHHLQLVARIFTVGFQLRTDVHHAAACVVYLQDMLRSGLCCCTKQIYE